MKSHRRFAWIFSSLAFAGGCVNDRPPVEAKPDVELPDTNVEVSIAPQPISVLVDGQDKPADISCNGVPRPDVGILVEDTSPVDTGSADTGSGDADPDATVDETSVDATTMDSTTATDSGPVVDAAPGTLLTETIELIAFGTGGADKLPGELVDVYYGNTFSGPPSLTGIKADDKGLLSVKLPRGVRVGYHVRASGLLSDFWALDDLHEPLAPAPLARWQGMTKEKQDLLALAVTGDKGYTIKPNTGIISARVVDCGHRTVQYAHIALRDYTDDPSGKELPFGKCGQGLCIVYLSDAELPDSGRTYTSRSGLFAMIDVPSNRKLGLIASGLTADGTVIQFSRRLLEVKEGAITFEYLEPSNKL